MINSFWILRKFQNWTWLWNWFWAIILTMNGVQIVRTFITYFFHRFKAFWRLHRFSLKISFVSRIPIETISRRELYCDWFFFLMRIWIFGSVFILVCRFSFKGCLIWIVLTIFNFHGFFFADFPWKLPCIFACSCERNISIFIFYSWNNFLSESRFMTWEIFTISCVNISIWLIWLRLWVIDNLLSGGGFCHGFS